jgi:hypothetical protein
MAAPLAHKKAVRVRPDSKGRIALGRLTRGVSSFGVAVEPGGKIVLEPFIEVPALERWLFENPEALKRVRRGLADSEAGRTVSLGSFLRRPKSKG